MNKGDHAPKVDIKYYGFFVNLEQSASECACVKNMTNKIKLWRTSFAYQVSSSSSTTPLRPRKRRPKTWKRNIARVKRAKGEEHNNIIFPTTGKVVEGAKQGPPCTMVRGSV